MPIQGPASAEDHDTQGLHCKQALEVAFQEGAGIQLLRLAEEAMELGWSELEVRSAIIDLVRTHFPAGAAGR